MGSINTCECNTSSGDTPHCPTPAPCDPPPSATHKELEGWGGALWALGHKDIAHHLKMLGKPFDWDTVQMPINVLDAHYRSFQNKVVPECTRRKIAVIGMKALAGGVIPRQLNISAEQCRRFALSLPISTLVCGIRSRKELK